MNPSVRDRLASVVRALGGVILPALPNDASLAKEQAMLAMGHIQIILAQMDAAPDFLADEAADFREMAAATAAAMAGGEQTRAAKAALEAALLVPAASPPEQVSSTLQAAIDRALVALAADGEASARAAASKAVLAIGACRADKDRRWFAAMGFDIDYSGG